MEHLTDKKLTEYAEQHSSPESELLAELNRQTHLKVPMPRMLSGHLQGRALAMFSCMLQPSRILEIGTYTGYSALCMCEGLRADGKLITIDVNEELEDMVRGYFERSGYASRIEYILGNALEVIPELKETFDLVFIDADKKSYAAYYDLVIEKVRPGGVIIADNVLRHGKIVAGNPDRETRNMQQFNEKVLADPRVENLLLPIRDGLMMARKRGPER